MLYKLILRRRPTMTTSKNKITSLKEAMSLPMFSSLCKDKKKNTISLDKAKTLTINDKLARLKGKTAAIYLRISTENQAKGMSIDAQKQQCFNFAEQAEINVKKIYHEHFSAMKPLQRKEFVSMLKAQYTENKADVLIFALCDRSTRNSIDLEILFEMVEESDLTIVFVEENQIIQSPILSSEKLFLRNIEVSSAYKVEHDRKICMIGSQKRAQSGFRPTKCCYGYRNPKGKHKTLVSKSEAEFVKAAFEMYATGNYSLKTLPEALLERGFRYKLQPSGIIPKQSLNSMLKNIFYTGKYTFTGTEGLIKGSHEAIISDELFDKVQAMLGEPPIEVRRYQHMYSKVIQCELCGNHMIGDKKVKPSGREYVYYRCMNQNCSNNKGGTNQNSIDEAIEGYFKEIRLNEIPKDLISMAIKESLAELKQRKSTLKRDGSRKFHAKIKHKEFVEANDIEDEEYINEIANEIESKYASIDDELESVDSQINLLTEAVNTAFTKRLSDVYINLSDTAKIEVIQLVKNKLTLNNKKLKMTFKPTFRKIRKR